MVTLWVALETSLPQQGVGGSTSLLADWSLEDKRGGNGKHPERVEGDTWNDLYNPSLCLGPYGFWCVLLSDISPNLSGLSPFPGLHCHQSPVTATVSEAIFIFSDFSCQSISSSLSVQDCHLNHIIFFPFRNQYISYISTFKNFATVSVITFISNHSHHAEASVKTACTCPSYLIGFLGFPLWTSTHDTPLLYSLLSSLFSTI